MPHACARARACALQTGWTHNAQFQALTRHAYECAYRSNRTRSITNCMLLCEHMLRLHTVRSGVWPAIGASIEFRIEYLWIARSNWKCRWIPPRKTNNHRIQCSRFARCKMENCPAYPSWAQNIHTFVYKCTTIQGFACIGHSQQDFRFIKFENYKLPVFTSRKYFRNSLHGQSGRIT